MTKLLIDGIEVDVPPEYTVLQACEAAGAEVPRFCFHERLSIAGNCRMCLVEVKGGPPKPQASCAIGVLVNISGGSPFGPGRKSLTPMAQLACGLGGPPFTSTRHMRQLPAIDRRSWKQKRGTSAPAASAACSRV